MGDTAADTLVIGKIVSCFGIKGWVKIHSYTDPMENFLTYGKWRVKSRGGRTGEHAGEALDFDAGHRQGKGLVAHIRGVDDRTLAESYKGLEIEVPVAELPELEEGEYYWRQLQGLQVWCREPGSAGGAEQAQRVLLGRVDHLIETGANDVLVVRPCEGSCDAKERLIPYLPGRVITRVDLDQAEMDVDWFLED